MGLKILIIAQKLENPLKNVNYNIKVYRVTVKTKKICLQRKQRGILEFKDIFEIQTQFHLEH